MTHHPQNGNLTLYYESTYRGFPVQTDRGPLVQEYLESLLQVILSALNHYNRVFAFRVDLRFPTSLATAQSHSNQVLERFIYSFKAKIRHNRKKAFETNRYAHDSVVRYSWCRELGQHGIPHYHSAILLNNDAFCTLGKFEIGRDNLFNRLHEAWASALNIPIEHVKGLVEFPTNPFYLLHNDCHESIAEFFYRASYLCKADSKHYGNGLHGFGTSRV